MMVIAASSITSPCAPIIGEGIAMQLVERGLDGLTAVGIRKCHLLIFNKNESGITFWQNDGWELRQDINIMSKYI